MSLTPASSLSSAKRARLWAQVAIPLLIAAIALPLIGRIYLALFEPAPGEHALSLIAMHVIGAAPAFLLAWTLMGLTKVLSEYEHGRFLSLEASAHLKRVGQGAVLALLAHFFIAPMLIALILGAPLFDALLIEPFSLGMLLFAAAMLTVGALLEDAAKALKADNDQIV